MNKPQEVPIPQRPPQLDYIYRANTEQQQRAEREAAELGNKIDSLIARRRQLEAEQSALWGKFAFRAVSSRELSGKALYRFDVSAKDADAQRVEVVRAGCLFVRTIDALIEQSQESMETNQRGVVARLPKATKAARAELDNVLVRQTALASELGKKQTGVGKLAAVAKRLEDASNNIEEAYRLAGERDQAGDDQQKETFRGLLQEMLVDYAEAALTADKIVSDLATEWNVAANANLAAPPLKPADPIPSVATATVVPSQVETPNVKGGQDTTTAKETVASTERIQVVTVSAKESWQRARVVKKGDKLRITADGTWKASKNDPRFSTDANGVGWVANPPSPLPGAPAYSLIGRIGKDIFFIGKATTIEAMEDGVLEVRMDCEDERLPRNDGALTVKTFLVQR